MDIELVKTMYASASAKCIMRSIGEPYPKAWTFEKAFIEVIVGECMDIIEAAVLQREPASTYVSKLEQHFGVTHETY